VTSDRTQIVKFVYAGLAGPLSIIPLKNLLAKGIIPEAILVPAPARHPRNLNLLPVKPPQNIASLAALAIDAGLPLISWQKGYEAEIEADLEAISPDLVIMSCFPWRVTEPLLAIPSLGWWNLHPSLLPAYRGPNPLYWQLEAGETKTGISLHQVDAGLDTGPVIAQQRCALTATMELENELAQLGANLIIESLQKQQQGNLVATPQDETLASYQSFPDQE